MAKAVRFYKTAGTEGLRHHNIGGGEPGPGQIRLASVGPNCADMGSRNGTYRFLQPHDIVSEDCAP